MVRLHPRLDGDLATHFKHGARYGRQAISTTVGLLNLKDICALKIAI
jgi:hypothetical protein